MLLLNVNCTSSQENISFCVPPTSLSPYFLSGLNLFKIFLWFCIVLAQIFFTRLLVTFSLSPSLLCDFTKELQVNTLCSADYI